VVGFSESLFQELLLSGTNVGVSVLCPGFVKTRIHESESQHAQGARELQRGPHGHAIHRRHGLQTARQRGHRPGDVADLVAELVIARKFWILPHERSALRTTELRLEWMRGGPPMRFDLMGATKP
jgi:short-subunit dehydrogenase